MRYLIADVVTEYTPKYDLLRSFSEPFIYEGERKTQENIAVPDRLIEENYLKMNGRASYPDVESFVLCNEFNKRILSHNAMFVHSSMLVYGNKAYLFAGISGSGKSTHTRLWLKAFGSAVHIVNDDKPVVRVTEGGLIACGTPFDGGSGIALNESYPLGSIVFVEKGEENSVRVPSASEAVSRLYNCTKRRLTANNAIALLDVIDRVVTLGSFRVLTCNTDISAAYTAFDSIIG